MEGECILTENMACVLHIAIEARKKLEASWGYTRPSAFLAGLEANLKYLKENGTLEVGP